MTQSTTSEDNNSNYMMTIKKDRIKEGIGECFLLMTHIHGARNLKSNKALHRKANTYVKIKYSHLYQFDDHSYLECDEPLKLTTRQIKSNKNPEWDMLLIHARRYVNINLFPVTLGVWESTFKKHTLISEIKLHKGMLPRNEAVFAFGSSSELTYSMGVFPAVTYLQHRLLQLGFQDVFKVDRETTDRACSFSCMNGMVSIRVIYEEFFSESAGKWWVPCLSLCINENAHPDLIVRFANDRPMVITSQVNPWEARFVSRPVLTEVVLNDNQFIYRSKKILKGIYIGKCKQVFSLASSQLLSQADAASGKVCVKTEYGYIKVNISPPHKPRFVPFVSDRFICDIVASEGESVRVTKPVQHVLSYDEHVSYKICMDDPIESVTNLTFVVYEKTELDLQPATTTSSTTSTTAATTTTTTEQLDLIEIFNL